MFIGKVSGSVVSTQKIDTVVGSKLLLVKAMSVKGDSPGELVDTGRVAVTVGPRASMRCSSRSSPWREPPPFDGVSLCDHAGASS